MLIADLAVFPDPQFARKNWTDLNGHWQFQFDDANRGLAERWPLGGVAFDRTIVVPFPFESELSTIHEPGYHPVIWYRRSLTDTRTTPDERLILHFGAVDFHAIVWVNGHRIGEHTGGHVPFSFDITDALEPDHDAHDLVVRVFDDPHDAEQPRGKQDWLPEPHIIWYHRTSGIWQSVWTEVTPPVRIERVRWRFDRARWLVDFEVELSGPPLPGSALHIELDHEGERITWVAVAADSRLICGQMPLGNGKPVMHPEHILWSPKHPNLIEATLTLDGGGFADTVYSYLGLRTVETTGRQFRLNGRAQFLRFVLNQGYWPESHLAAPSPSALEREVDLIMQLGFNGARNHQKVEDPRFLYWADRKGLMLWGEAPAAFTFSELAIDRHAAEWREAVLRDRNHPSIIAWVPFNESWGVGEIDHSSSQQAAVKAAYFRTHQLDGTRPVIGNDGWDNLIGDLFTIHDYTWDVELLERRYRNESELPHTIATLFPGSRRLVIGDFDTDDKPVMVTEFGGVSFAPKASEEWYGYGKVRTLEAYFEKYRDMVQALSSSELICGFCYTQLTDTLQETNGLLTDQREPKVAIERLAAATRGE